LETSEARQTGRYREENHPVSSTHTRRQVAPDDPGPGEGRTGGGPDRPPRRHGGEGEREASRSNVGSDHPTRL